MTNNQVCRLCLKLSAVYYNIFENDVSKMLGSIVNKTVVPNIEISAVICPMCLITLKTAYKFQQKVKENEEKLLEEAKLAPKIELYELQERQDVVDLCDTTCLVCGEMFGFYDEENSINIHIQKHFYEEQVCEICERSFFNVKEFRRHFKTAKNHKNKKVYECKECNANFLYKSFYDVHRKSVCTYDEDVSIDHVIIKEEIMDDNEPANTNTRRKKKIKIKFCETCSKDVPWAHNHILQQCPICERHVSRNNYRGHIRLHKSHKQICHLCGKIYSNHIALSAHIRRQHENKKKIYKCEDCDKVYYDKGRIVTHRHREHMQNFTHYCENCGKGFYASKDLNKHVKVAHLKLREHICQYCKRAFGTKFTLTNHLRQHTNETPFRCEECGDGFKHNVSLKTHLKSKHNIVEKIVCNCKVCGKGFASEAGLNSHLRLHKLIY